MGGADTIFIGYGIFLRKWQQIFPNILPTCLWDRYITIYIFPSFDRITGSAGSVFVFKSKWYHFSKKKIKKAKVNWFSTRSCRVSRVTGSTGSHRVFSSPIFSSTRPGSSPKSARSQVNPMDRTEFQNYNILPFLVKKSFQIPFYSSIKGFQVCLTWFFFISN